jgi:hypothetical protein
VNGSLAALEGVILAAILISYEKSGYLERPGLHDEKLLIVSGERELAGAEKDAVWLIRKSGDCCSMMGLTSPL